MVIALNWWLGMINQTIFRLNILQALKDTSTDEDLKKELHQLLESEIKKDVPYLVRPIKQVNKTIH